MRLKLKKPFTKLSNIFSSPEKRRFLIMRTAGNFLVLFSLFGVAATFAPAVKSELDYRLQKAAGIKYEIQDHIIIKTFNETSSTPLSRLLRSKRLRTEHIAPASTDFGIVIPKIGANARIIANVDPGNEREYQKALEQGVAHARGTAFPERAALPEGKKALRKTPSNSLESIGEGLKDKKINRKIYLFAHSTDNWWNINRYNAVFFLLREIETGEQINIFYKGQRFIYKAVKKEIVDADQVEYLTEPSESEVLILQTCWPPGTTWKRLIVIAKPVSDL